MRYLAYNFNNAMKWTRNSHFRGSKDTVETQMYLPSFKETLLSIIGCPSTAA